MNSCFLYHIMTKWTEMKSLNFVSVLIHLGGLILISVMLIFVDTCDLIVLILAFESDAFFQFLLEGSKIYILNSV